MSAKLKRGDVVRLKGQIQMMVVDEVRTDGIVCKWITNIGYPKTETYPLATLDLLTEEEWRECVG